MKHSIGIDLGTSSVKVTAISKDGSIITETSRSYPTSKPVPEAAEQNPDHWFEETLNALQKISEKLQKKNPAGKNRPEALGISGQMHGLVPCDSDMQVLRPAIIWADNRPRREVEQIKDSLSQSELKKLGSPAVTGFTLPKLLWLRHQEPEIWEELKKVMLPKDYLGYHLTGNIATDYTDASGTLIFDVKKKEWSRAVVDKFNIESDLLPELKPPGSVLGTLKQDITEQLGWKDRTIPVIIGGGDAPLTALASGVTDSDTAGISLGTAGQIIKPLDEFRVESELRLHTMAFALPGKWFMMGAMLAAGYNLRWMLENIIKTDQQDAEFLKDSEDSIKNVPPGSQGLIYLPYILGERSPLNDPLASASFWGLKDFHEQQHLLRAVMEGVAMAMRWNLSLMRKTAGKPQKIYLSGGGARSEVWPEILADILNIPVYSCDRPRGPAYGAALLAGESAGLINGVKKALEQNRKKYDCFQPADENSSLYGEIFEIYRDLYRDNRDKMHRLNDLRRSMG